MKSTARLYCLLARESSQGVVFRRGPSNRVLLIKWNLRTDSFERGQWLNARVYERRCDLSPDGSLLVYFAADFRRSIRSWTAISRPPFFTAIALWPKGDSWGGGGLFATNHRVLLNHPSYQMAPDPDFPIPNWFSSGTCGDWAGGGEDQPIWFARLLRDGWKLIAYPERTRDERGAQVQLEYDPPILWEKEHPLWPSRYTLQMAILGIGERNGPWWLVDHVVRSDDGYAGLIGRSEWADWSKEGHLLFAQSGCLYRLQPARGKFGPIEDSEQIADFNSLRFERVEPTNAALSWPARKAAHKQKRSS